MRTGKLISIEGTEGAGKSTALEFIRNYLTGMKVDVAWTREPGGTEIAEEIRRLVLHPQTEEEIEPEAELLMMFAARIQHLRKIILPALSLGKFVVIDRFIDASYAYQGGGRGVDLESIRWLDQWIVGPVYPSLTLLLDVEPEKGFERAAKRSTDKDRIEREDMDFFVRVRNTYLERAKDDPERIKIIDASLSLPAVQEQIRDVLDNFLQLRVT